MCVCVVVCQAKSANIDSDDVCLDRYFPAKVMQDLIAEASRLKGAKPTTSRTDVCQAQYRGQVARRVICAHFCQVVVTNVGATYLKSFGDNEGGGFEFSTKKRGSDSTSIYVWVHVQVVQYVRVGCVRTCIFSGLRNVALDTAFNVSIACPRQHVR